jgi:hypothetical protein
MAARRYVPTQRPLARSQRPPAPQAPSLMHTHTPLVGLQENPGGHVVVGPQRHRPVAAQVLPGAQSEALIHGARQRSVDTSQR